jgi:formate hydrogenlyase transcriptional activator
MSNSELIGSSSKFRAVLDEVNTVASTNCTVLIQGETGTGKEVIAQAIHKASSRRNNRFIALNCAAIPAALLESELFGHERGAFTGAVAQTMGRFQAADRGTLLLDEIGELPLELQPKLLRALQEKEVERLGAGRAIQVDVRVIAATNQDLWQMVQQKRFRADLYYRLNVFPMTLPSLRERREDIRLLVEHFVQKFSRQQGKKINTIPDYVMTALEQHNWHGNIRELQNVIERGVLMTIGTALSRHTTEQLKTPEASPVTEASAVELVSGKTLADAERAHIASILRETNWIIGGPRGAAAVLGLPRTTLIARMQRLGISGGAKRTLSGRSALRLAEPVGEFSSHRADDSSDSVRIVRAAA